MKSSQALVLLMLGLLAAPSFAQTVKDREGAVRDDRAQMQDNERWIYNDIDAGFRAARETGKPLMVVLRCVPCMACMGIDTEVLTENSELTPLMDQFVRVRVINANALNLNLFQFDYDLSFSTLFFNGDGTVYGRYGSWKHQEDSQDRATTTFRLAMEQALKIHKEYPSNKESLAGKQGKASRYATPIAIPQLSGKYKADLDWDGKLVQSCVHCHQIGDVQRLSLRQANQPLPLDLIYPHPAPETIGMHLSREAIATISGVDEGSPAARAGLQSGDKIIRLDRQPLISIADVSWILHNAPDVGSIRADVVRGDEFFSVDIALPKGWRTNTDITHRVGTWPMRAMAFGGMKMDDMTDDERAAHRLNNRQLALRINHVGQYGNHAAAKKQGFQKDDILIAVGGFTQRATESQIIGHLITKYRPGAKVPATVLRNGKRVELQLPVQ